MKSAKVNLKKRKNLFSGNLKLCVQFIVWNFPKAKNEMLCVFVSLLLVMLSGGIADAVSHFLSRDSETAYPYLLVETGEFSDNLHNAIRNESFTLTAHSTEKINGEVADIEVLTDLSGLFRKQGRMFSEYEMRFENNSALISEKLFLELFGDSFCIGKSIEIKGKTYRIIGVADLPDGDKSGTVIHNTSGFKDENYVFVTYSSAEAALLESATYSYKIYSSDLDKTEKKIRGILGGYGIEDYGISRSEDVTGAARALESTVKTALLILSLSVFAVSFFVIFATVDSFSEDMSDFYIFSLISGVKGKILFSVMMLQQIIITVSGVICALTVYLISAATAYAGFSVNLFPEGRDVLIAFLMTELASFIAVTRKNSKLKKQNPAMFFRK